MPHSRSKAFHACSKSVLCKASMMLSLTRITQASCWLPGRERTCHELAQAPGVGPGLVGERGCSIVKGALGGLLQLGHQAVGVLLAQQVHHGLHSTHPCQCLWAAQPDALHHEWHSRAGASPVHGRQHWAEERLTTSMLASQRGHMHRGTKGPVGREIQRLYAS